MLLFMSYNRENIKICFGVFKVGDFYVYRARERTSILE